MTETEAEVIRKRICQWVRRERKRPTGPNWNRSKLTQTRLDSVASNIYESRETHHTVLVKLSNSALKPGLVTTSCCQVPHCCLQHVAATCVCPKAIVADCFGQLRVRCARHRRRQSRSRSWRRKRDEADEAASWVLFTNWRTMQNILCLRHDNQRRQLLLQTVNIWIRCIYFNYSFIYFKVFNWSQLKIVVRTCD